MDGNERRRKIVELMLSEDIPVSGKKLAELMKVSRQVIVQDIALLRAENIDIVSTTKGYMISKINHSYSRRYYVKHTDEEMEDELLAIIDQGGRVCDVIVQHPIYGEIKAELPLRTRQDVYDFIQKVKNKETVPLSKLTNQIHAHTVEADSKEILDKIQVQLSSKNYLLDK